MWPIIDFLVGQGNNWIQGQGTCPSDSGLLVSLGNRWGWRSPGRKLVFRPHCWTFHWVLEGRVAHFLRRPPTDLPRTMLNEYEGTLCIVSWSWSLGLSRTPLSGKNKTKPNKIKPELTQHDAVFLVLLLENNCKYFMALQVGVNDFSVLRTMKNTLGM